MRRSILYTVMTFFILGLAACASTYRGYGHSGIVIDEKGVDMEQFYVDLADCEQYAAGIDKATSTAGKAVEGAVVGGAIGAIFDGSHGAARGAGTGAVLSGAQGAKTAEYEKRHVIRNCLRGRGYRVLN
ncbi:glycine zipper family protein [Porticoccaceae bacterium LTM1]|nr:glycine zipper family protein [Porticoccaceae bacterium LTM1]